RRKGHRHVERLAQCFVDRFGRGPGKFNLVAPASHCTHQILRSLEAVPASRRLRRAGAPDTILTNSDADWIAPTARVSPASSCGSGNPPCKVNINDSDHSYFGMWNDNAQQNRNYAWEN